MEVSHSNGYKFDRVCKKLFEQRDKSEACEDLDVGDMSEANFLSSNRKFN